MQQLCQSPAMTKLYCSLPHISTSIVLHPVSLLDRTKSWYGAQNIILIIHIYNIILCHAQCLFAALRIFFFIKNLLFTDHYVIVVVKKADVFTLTLGLNRLICFDLLHKTCWSSTNQTKAPPSTQCKEIDNCLNAGIRHHRTLLPSLEISSGPHSLNRWETKGLCELRNT